MSEDLIVWLRDRLDEDEKAAQLSRSLLLIADLDRCAVPGSDAEATFRHFDRYGPARVLAKVAADRLILAEHLPVWRTVEWPHDQNGKGEAQVCPRCQNAEHTHWNPPVGHAGVPPAGFITPYVLAPCATLRLLALPYADQPGYRGEWRP